MPRVCFYLLALLLALPAFAARKDRHVILITIDGFPARLWNDPSLPLPTLRQLAAQGAAATAMETSNPSVTWPAHTTLVTGVSPRTHGVLFNGLVVRQGPGKPLKIEPWVDKTKLVFTPTLYDIAHAAGLTTAESDWVAVTRAKGITWSFGEIPNPTGPVEQAMIAAGVATPDDMQKMQPGQGRKTIWRDNMWTRAAGFMFSQYKPNLLLYHTLNTDGIHHRYGPGTDPSHTALAYADRLVGDLLKTVDETGLRSQTTIIITTDHGFKTVTQYMYPNVVLKQAGLLKAAGPTVTHCDAYTLSSGGIAQVYVTDPARRAELVPKLKELFSQAAGVDRVIDGRDGHSIGLPTPEENASMGDLILYAKTGHAFSGAANGDVIVGPTVNYSGTHGYFNGDPELDGIFIASGAGIKPGVKLGKIRNVDVAPTLARLMQLDLPKVEGRVLEEILTGK